MPDQQQESRPKLIIFGGLPGVGKSTIARRLSSDIGAVYLRIDSIEQALRDFSALTKPMDDAGYRIAYALAEENLRLGHIVIADCVNPISVTRSAWRQVAERMGVRHLEIEILCSDNDEHRHRVESRAPDIPGLIPPTWGAVLAREYEPWDQDHLQVDTSGKTPEQVLTTIRQIMKI